GAEAVHGGQVVFSKKLRHEGDFFYADTMFAGHAATAGDALLEDFAAGGQDAFDLRRVALVEEQNRMDIAVAGVKDVDDLDIVLAANFHDPAEDMRQFSARHDAVLSAIARTYAADRAECLFAAFPQLLPVLRRGRLADLACLVLTAQLDDSIALCIQAHFQTINFN